MSMRGNTGRIDDQSYDSSVSKMRQHDSLKNGKKLLSEKILIFDFK
jgi:hypothetical protein